ncbi:MAG TPA: beta-ketoacyl synthase N-terminal-like domain-containing protein, partial [Dongiaceae bacterium]|nr:beta-ketoacyl synthase N-terminal-like domain-containing protein [Dongiaceae bacterium]
MRFTRPAHDLRLAGFGVLTPAGAGTAPLLDRRVDPPARRLLPVDPAGLCGDPPDQLRRADRYGAIGYAAASMAFRDAAAPADATTLDPRFGVMIGSSIACWSANRRFHEEHRDQPPASLSPALFVRTVANAVNGDISIARRLAGPCDTFVSGFTAGAEALIAAAAAIDAGRADAILAGGVEAPEGFLEPPPEGFPVEAAGVALLRRGHVAGATPRDDDALRLV